MNLKCNSVNIQCGTAGNDEKLLSSHFRQTKKLNFFD